jgi:hypothetical protein
MLILAGVLPAHAAVVSVPLSVLPVSAPAFSGAAVLTAPTMAAAPNLLAAPALTPSLSAAFAAVPAASAAAAAAAPALPALAAAEEGPETPKAPEARQAPVAASSENPAPKSAEEDAAAARARFDGEAPAPAVPVVPAQPLGSGLMVAKDEHNQWLHSAVEALSRSRTGRRVLRDIDALAARNGRAVMMDVKAIGNNGEFRYDSDLLVMDSKHLKSDPLHSAPILAHELQHVLQRAMGLPVDALELEIESYTVENRVWSELGIEPENGSFAQSARRRILKDLPAFAKWLGGQYSGNIALYGSSMKEYVEEVEKKLASVERGEARARKKRAAVVRTLESMRGNGMSEETIAAHRREDLEPIDRYLRDSAVNRTWLERDRSLLSTPGGRKLFADYVRGVIRRARSLSRARTEP